MGLVTKAPKLDKCPRCNQSTYHINFVLEDNMRYEHVICRHCKKEAIKITYSSQGEIVEKVHTVKGVKG